MASRLDARKAAATAHALSFGSRLRSGCASPQGLWLAGCAGFLAADWMQRPAHEPCPTRKQRQGSSRPSQSAAMSKALLLLELALDLGIFLAKEVSPGFYTEKAAEEARLNSTVPKPPSSC